MVSAIQVRPLTGEVTEAQFEATFVDVARRTGWDLRYHTHNSRRSRVGFPDWTLVHERQEALMFIELKGWNTPLGVDQLRWVNAIRATGVPAMIARPRDWPTVADWLFHPRAVVDLPPQTEAELDWRKRRAG